MDDLREIIEAVVKEPLDKMAKSVDRAIKLVMSSREIERKSYERVK